MEITIRADFEFTIPLTMADVECLMKLSRHHYDGKCKQASAEPYTSKANFLTGWRNSIAMDMKYNEMCDSGEIKRDEGEEPIVPTIRATWDNLDTSLKIMEMSSYLTREDAVYAASVKKMRGDFNGALTLAREKYREWQTTYTSTR